MKKNEWSNFFGTVFAGITVGTVAIAGKHFAKKYGQKPNTNKLFDIKLSHLADYGINKFLESDSGESNIAP